MFKEIKLEVSKAFIAITMFCVVPMTHAESQYDPTTGTVIIDSILFNGTLYKEVIVIPGSIISIGASLPAESRIKTNLSAVYNGLTGHLTLQTVIVDRLSYSDVVITIKEATSYDSTEFIGVADDYSDRSGVNLSYLAASDVSQSYIDTTLDFALRVTNDWFKDESPFWKHYHPIDIWLVGSDLESAVALNVRACERLRKVYPDRYLRDACNPDSGSGLEFAKFDDYINGGASINSSVILDGYHWMYVGPGMELGRTIAHEAWHMWQLAHLVIQDNEWVEATGLRTNNSSDNESIQNILMGKETGSLADWTPIDTENSYGKGPSENNGTWWHEGGAEYMAISWYSRQPEARAFSENQEELNDYLNDQISVTIRDYVQQFRDTGLKVYELAYKHGNLGYKIGFLFYAFLVKEVGLDVINNGFWGEVGKLGFDSTFLKYFGKTYQEYGLEFEALVQKPDSEIFSLLILPAT